jgi:hypothetical protein
VVASHIDRQKGKNDIGAGEKAKGKRQKSKMQSTFYLKIFPFTNSQIKKRKCRIFAF